ncbi:MAG: YkgJ family cysteine cluster protein [Oligoflexia bacterium]|nr:YkgJ family cysteine cluster protein [Oligoflexia bacterium]
MGDRCTGHCCRGFALEKSLEEVWADFDRWKRDPSTSTVPDVYLIAPMLIPLRKIREEWLYTCKHLHKSGDCGIYERRPRMCRDFPGEKQPCPFPICATHGKKNLFQKVLAWLRT